MFYIGYVGPRGYKSHPAHRACPYLENLPGPTKGLLSRRRSTGDLAWNIIPSSISSPEEISSD